MANLSTLNTVIQDLFAVVGTVISEIVILITGDLIILSVTVAIVGLIIGIIYVLMKYIKGTVTQSMGKTKMK